MYEVLYQNSFFTLRSLNIAIVLGFLFGVIFCIRYVERHKMNQRFLTKYFLYLVVSGLVGGRLFYVLENLEAFQTNLWRAAYFWDLNFSFFGILTGLILAIFILTKKTKEDFWAWTDAAFLSTLAVMIFIHVGYFFSGVDYGLPTGLPWGMTFEATHIPFTTPIHPTQLYAALMTFILLGYGVERSKRIHLSGVVGTRVMMLYALGMLGIDFLHGNPSLYVKISFGILAILCFIASVHSSHKTHISQA